MARQMTHNTDGVPCMLMRGGTSKGAYFLRDDLPSNSEQRDQLLLRMMGTPDARQIDGIGGAHPLTSKVAIIAPSQEHDIDVDYLFLQIGTEEPTISDRQNCGNLLAGVGPFALERNLVEPTDGEMEIRIRMLNTSTLAVATFATTDGAPDYAGDTAISGSPGTGSPIRLDFEDIAGSTCGSLLPTGKATNVVAGVACTLIDNGMPVVVMRATDVGVTGYESCSQLESNTDLTNQLEAMRHGAGELMSLGDVAGSTIPKLTLVAAPTEGGALCTRTFIPHRCHDAIGVLGAVSVATASLLQGSPAAAVAEISNAGSIVVEHPTGTFEVNIELSPGSGTIPTVTRAGIIRTARKLMDGVVYPRPY